MLLKKTIYWTVWQPPWVISGQMSEERALGGQENRCKNQSKDSLIVSVKYAMYTKMARITL